MDLSIEENVKVAIVLEFLKSLGFQEDELKFETNFHLALGRYTYRVDTEQQCHDSSPRLDILVTRNGNNLFVIEVKNDQILLGKKEIEQATSYARLVDPVAPFAIITNGKDFQIYDSLTRQEINKNEFRIQGLYSVSISDEQRYEALKHFIGYSTENVRYFCNKQVTESMKTLLGSKQKPNKKYIPELYTTREELHTAFRKFLDTDQIAFSIIGDSGIGKTCSMCDLALCLINENRPVLFYRARDLIDGITKSIADDFNWEFTSQYSEIQVFRRVTQLFSDNHLVIFIDAIDEWTISNRVEILGNFLRQIANRDTKIILSCKTAVWDDFLNSGGMPTYISEIISESAENKVCYHLQSMTEKEFHHALSKYREFYGYKGLFEDRVLNEGKRNPFLLRVFFEVAHNIAPKFLTFSSIEFFDEYYHQILAKFSNRDVAYATLKAVAKSLLNRNSESTSMDNIRNDLGLSVNDPLMPELFDHNILEISGDRLNGEISFYFDKLRDYIVSNHVMKLKDMSIDEYSSSVYQLQSNQIFQQVLKFYYPSATQDKQEVIDHELRTNANEYLSLYNEIINKHFPKFKRSFSPHTEGEIGFLGEISLSKKSLIFYGFRPLEQTEDEKIKFIPVDLTSFEKGSNISFLYGARGLHMTSSSGGFKDINVKKEVLRNEIESQLIKIVQTGMLSEQNNKYLMIEKCIAIVTKYQAKHHNISSISKMSSHLPITFEAIEYALRYERATRIYFNELIESKRKAGLIQETWKGSGFSSGGTLSKEDQEWIRTHAEEKAGNKIYLETDIEFVGFDEIERDLAELLLHLCKYGLDSISESIVPDIDNNHPKYFSGFYSYETWCKHIERIYSLFLDEYTNLIKTNFPTLSSHFALYSHSPVIFFITVDKQDGFYGNDMIVYQCKNNAGACNEVVLCQDNISYNQDSFQVTHSGKIYDCLLVEYTSTSHLMIGMHRYISYPVTDSLLPLRNLVYEQIHKELDKVIVALFNLYGITRQ